MNKKLKDKYINLLKNICFTETPSGNAENINALANMMEAFAKDNGYKTERFPFEKAGDFLLIKSGSNPSKKTCSYDGAYGYSPRNWSLW